MDFELSEDQRLLRDTLTELGRSLNDDLVQRDHRGEFRRQAWDRCGEVGLQGLPLPSDVGGGADLLTTGLALEAFGSACRDEGLTFSICAHMQSCAMPIAAHGDEAQKQRYLPDLANGRRIGGNATTEPDSGSDAFAMRTTAVRDGEVYRLDGRKTFVTNGPVADLLLVYAVTDPEQRQFGGISAFLVDTDTPGIEIGPNLEKIGLRTSTWCEVAFDGCAVPVSQRLGGEGAGTAIFASSMDWERLLVSFSYVGRMGDTLERTLRYARERRQFGKPIGKHAAVADKIVAMKTDVEASRLLLYRAAWEQQRTRRSAGLHISLAKLFTSEARVRSALKAIEVHGGYGCASDFEIERELRNAVPGTIASGTSEVQKMVIARHLGL